MDKFSKLNSVAKIGIVLSILVFLILILAVVFSLKEGGKDKDFMQDGQSQDRKDDTQPILYNLGGIKIKPYDSSSGLAGDIKFTKDTLHVQDGLETPIVIFGQKLPKSGNEPQRLNPNFEFRSLSSAVELVSAIDGVVAFIESQPETNDYEVFFSINNNATWMISYDHVTNLKVKQGDKVKAGQSIGKAALERNNSYRYELQINHEVSDMDAEMVCPTALLAPEVKTEFLNDLSIFVSDWESWYGKNTFPENQGGCVKESLNVKEAEGI